MRRYTILSILRTINGTVHRYDAVRRNDSFTGNYVCPTLDNDTKIVTDFLCMPNSKINSVKDETRPDRSAFAIGDTTRQGRITGFKPSNNQMEVYLNGAKVNTVLLNALTPIPNAVPVIPVVAPAAPVVAPSRSQISQELTNIENKILAAKDIRLEKFLKKNLPPTLEEFLIKFFTNYNIEKATIYVDDKKVQTTSGRRRSVGDIYKICKYYYPNCTFKEVLTLLYKTLAVKFKEGFRFSYCNTIHKRVFYYEQGRPNYVENSTDEYGKSPNFYLEQIK